MTQSSTADNTVLQLYPPKIQGQTEPVIGAHVGVSLVVYDLVADGEGAKVQIDPPLVGIWEPEDVVKLWLVNDTTLLSFTTIGDPNVPIFLRIPKNRLHANSVNQLYYTVERNGGNVGDSKPPLTVLYNRIRPGLKDRFPEIDGHSELKLDLSELIEQGVDKDFVSAPVCFSYPYCRAYDTITLKCNGEIQTFPVSKDQAPQPPNPGTEVPTTLCFTVEREFLDKAKRQDKVLNFSYTANDQLLNGPDPDAVWSAAVAVNEDLDGELLDKPILRETAGDTTDDPGIIDLKKLGSNPLLLYISTVDPRFEPGHKIEATYTAKIPGQDDKTVVLTGQVETDDIGNKVTCILKVLNGDVIVASSVTVTYKLRKPDDNLVGSSNTATATVTGSVPIELLPPFLVAPAVEPIEVLAYPNGVAVRIEYLEAQNGDRARLVEVNPPAGSPQFPLVEFNSNKRVNTVLSQAFLAARHGKEITLRWNLNRNSSQVGKSASVKMSVLKFADGDSRFPVFRIDEANDATHVLNLKDFQGNCTVSMAPNSLIMAGHHLWLDVVLNKTSAQPIVIPLARGDIINTEEQNTGVRRILFRSDLENLQHESTLELVPKIFFGPNPTEEHSTKLPTTDYTLHNPSLFIEEDFSNIESHKLNVGQSINIGTMTISNIRETSVSGDYTGIGPPLTVGWGSQCLKVRDTVKIDLNGKTATEIDCTVLNSQTNNGITFYNAAGIMIHSVADLTRVPIKLPNNLEFSSLIITTQIVPGSGDLRDYLDIDNIKITLSI